MIGSTLKSTTSSRDASPHRTAAPQARSFEEVADLFSNAQTPDACAAAADAFVKDLGHRPEGALAKLCSLVPTGEDRVADVCGRIADGLGTAKSRNSGQWQELLQAVKSAPDSANKQRALHACAQHFVQLRLDEPVLWEALLDALPSDVSSEALAETAKAMADAGVEAPATWSSLAQRAAAPADLAASLSKADVASAHAWVALREGMDKSGATAEEKAAVSRTLVDTVLRSPAIDASALKSAISVVGWPVVMDSLSASTPSKALAVIAEAAMPADLKRVLGFMTRLAEKQPGALPDLFATLINLRIDDGALWTKALSIAAGLRRADVAIARAVCGQAIPFLRASGLTSNRECMAYFIGLRSNVDYVYSWDQMMDQVRKKHPGTQAGWPACVPTYKDVFTPMATRPAPRTDDEYKAQIIGNGKLLVGDYHNVPEGMTMLCHMMNTLPVGGLFLEERVSIVLENAPFMAWLKENPDATPAQTLDKAIELCWSAETPASPMFRELKGYGFALLTLQETADTWVRWMELECAVARTVIAKEIPVKQLFNSSLMVHSNEPRRLDPAAWEEFNHPQQGCVNVFFGGELHISDNNYIDQETHALLAKSGGVFAQGTFSRLADDMNKRYMRQSFFFQKNPQPWGNWKAELSVPGVSSSGPDVAPQGEPCVHDVVFHLYPKQPWQ